MSVLVYLCLALVAFGVAIRFYGKYLARQMGEDGSRPTPAHQFNDGRDFVPTKPYVLFAHHFSAIAGAGPILGPTVAILYGFVPAWLWVVLGGIFIGAVHDFMALFVCMREGGRSLAEVARKTLGKGGFVLFILFTILMLVLVTSSFLSAVSMSLTSLWPLEKLGLSEGQTILKTEVHSGVVMGRIGGIASMSVIIVTAFSPLLGWLIYKKNLHGALAYLLASVVCIGSIVVGIFYPVVLPGTWWTIIISIYVFFAAGVPVWVILQPRDFINVQILYAGIGLLVVALLVAGGTGATFAMPAFNFREGAANLGFVWPMMFIMVACGAISGFHSLVAGGTTTKQLNSERDARRIGFNAMLLESLLAVCVLLALCVGLNFADYKSIVYPAAQGVKSNPILAFSLSVGRLLRNTLHIPVDLGTVFGILLVEGFVITTLDAAVRLNRYLFEELWAMVFAGPDAAQEIGACSDTARKTGTMQRNAFGTGAGGVLMLLGIVGVTCQVSYHLYGTAIGAGVGLLVLSVVFLVLGYVLAFQPMMLRNYWLNSGLAVLLMWVLGYTNAFNALWPIFGAANQLLAALGLITVSVWMLLKGRKYLFALAPALFMMATTLASLVILLFQYVKKSNAVLAVTAVLLLGLSLGVIGLVFRKVVRPAMPLPKA
jgi:carbon starvation protein